MLLLLEAQEGNWEDIDAMIRTFQKATTGLRYSEVPVVVAPLGLTLGGGCEIVLHGDRVQAAAESYIGLVEVGVGLIPAGGGTKEMLLRLGPAEGVRDDRLREDVDVGAGRAALGYLRDVDGMTMNRDRLVYDAKQLALERAQEGYRPPRRPVGDSGRRRRRSRDARSRRAPRLARRPHHRSRRAHRPQAVVDSGRRLLASRRDGQRRSVCWISSARRFSACAASQRHSSAFSTR